MPNLRHFWQRILYGDPGSEVLVDSEAPPTIQQELENAVTYVAEFNVSNWTDVMPVTGEPVTIDQIRLYDETGDGYPMRPLFTGTLNTVTGRSYPNSATLSCTGPLAKLRKVRVADLDVSGMTDGEAWKEVMDFCGVAYDDANVDEWGYELGAVKPVIWRRGQSGAEFVAELDRVFGMATIELGDGSVWRFAYDKAPDAYADDLYSGIYNVAMTFTRGQEGATFYDNERDLGDVDQIGSYVRVQGLQYEGAEGTADEGCTFDIYADAIADHPKLGAGQYVAPIDFSSDLIQHESLAKAVAVRIMRWGNREPDLLRVETANHASLTVGDLIEVRDEAPGIGITTYKRYLILRTARTADFMSLDCVGGAAGATGTITSGIRRCCGTQLEDGTCDETGTNPDPGSPPAPGVPGDPGVGVCDPIADPTCIPGVDTSLPDPPNVLDPFINCQGETGEVLQGDATNPICVGGGAGEWVTPSTTCWDAPWRISESNVLFNIPCNGGAGGPIDKFGYSEASGLGVVLTYNTTPNDCGTSGSEKTAANDFVFPGGSNLCVSGTAYFCGNGQIQVIYESTSDLDLSAVTFYVGEGFTFGGIEYGVVAHSENNGTIKVGHGPPNRSIDASNRDNGGLGGFPASPGEVSFNVCFDVASGYQRVIYGGSFGGGYMEDERTIESMEAAGTPGFPFAEQPSDSAGHTLTIRHIFDDNDGTCVPWIRLNEMGHSTCEINPNYTNPFVQVEV